MVKRSDGRWQESVVIKGKRKYFYGKTKAEVLRKINSYQEELEDSEKFPAVVDAWWEEHEPTIASNTMKSYKPAMERAKTFFDCPIREIKPSDVSKAMQRYVRLYKPARKTATNQLLILNLVFKYAVTQGYIEFNPAREISVPKGLQKKKRGVPSSEDLERVKACTDLPFGMFAYWILYTGLRRGELMALTWKDVDMENRIIHVNKSLHHPHNQPVVKTPKTDAGVRMVPIVDKLYEKLKPGKGIIFDQDGKYMSSHFCTNEWKRYQKAAGISCTPHELRHAFATMLFENNISAKDAQEILGHAQISTTMDVYTSVRQERTRVLFPSLFNVDIVSAPIGTIEN